jgi:hypothetical protein
MMDLKVILESCLEEAKQASDLWGQIIRALVIIYEKYKNMDVIETAFGLYFNNRNITQPDSKFFEYLAAKKTEEEANTSAVNWNADVATVYKDIKKLVDPILGKPDESPKSSKLKKKSGSDINQKQFLIDLTNQREKGYNKFIIKFAFDLYKDFIFDKGIRSGWWNDDPNLKFEIFGGAAYKPDYKDFQRSLKPWDKKAILNAFKDIKKTLNPVYGIMKEQLTQFQDYTSKHDPHSQSLSRTMGKGQENRQSLKMGSAVRTDKQNPYQADVMNRAEKSPVILTSKDMAEIDSFLPEPIDWNDRRVKSPKGKTGMILTPLVNGGWQLSHR